MGVSWLFFDRRWWVGIWRSERVMVEGGRRVNVVCSLVVGVGLSIDVKVDVHRGVVMGIWW